MQRRSTIPIPAGRAHMLGVLAKACRPRPITTVSQWADRHRVLTSKGSGEPGRWRTERTPYLREILDQLSASSATQRIVLKFGAQLGKTEVSLNWIGYVMEHAPAPMLTVVPTLEVRKRWVKQRLDPMLDETPALRAMFDARRKRDAANAEDMKDFPGGILVLSGANSPSSLASMPIRYVVCDEVDRFPWEAGEEGDPLGLVEERTNSFPRRKILLISTPTTAGISRIDDEYQSSSQGEFYVPCPHCGTYQVLRWRQETGDYGLVHQSSTGQVYYRCIDCHDRIDEHHKAGMLAAGHWRHKHPERKSKGYHLSGLYSAPGLGVSWAEIWAKWEDAQGDTAKLKRFVNTTLAETWQEEGDSLEPVGLMARLEEYPDSLPATIRTAGVDVQKDRLEITLVDWGQGEEAWLHDHIALWGDTTLPEVWGELGELLADLNVNACGIDAGYNTSLVLAFVEGRSWCWPIKGTAGPHRPIIEDERKRRYRDRARRRKGQPQEIIGVDQAKALIYARAKLPQPGPGYLHFPRTPSFDDEYFSQLSAEKLITKVRGNRATAEWIKTRARNEALDCLVYALAALRLSGVDLNTLQPDAPKRRWRH